MDSSAQSLTRKALDGIVAPFGHDEFFRPGIPSVVMVDVVWLRYYTLDYIHYLRYRLCLSMLRMASDSQGRSLTPVKNRPMTQFLLRSGGWRMWRTR